MASAATLPLVCGAKRYMDKNSYVLIHQLRGSSSGKYEDMKISINNKDMFMNNIKKIYNEKCGINVETLDELLRDDDWYPPEICKELNIIDEII